MLTVTVIRVTLDLVSITVTVVVICTQVLTSLPLSCIGNGILDTFLALITGCAKVGDIRRGESVYKIIAVRFFSLTGNTPDEDMIPAPFDLETAGEYEKGPGLMPHPCRELEKVLCNGAFFFSPQIDLTRSIQARYRKKGGSFYGGSAPGGSLFNYSILTLFYDVL